MRVPEMRIPNLVGSLWHSMCNFFSFSASLSPNVSVSITLGARDVLTAGSVSELSAFRPVRGTVSIMDSHESETLREIEQSLREQDPALAAMLSASPSPPRSSKPVRKVSWYARLEERAAERWARRTGRPGR